MLDEQGGIADNSVRLNTKEFGLPLPIRGQSILFELGNESEPTERTFAPGRSFSEAAVTTRRDLRPAGE